MPRYNVVFYITGTASVAVNATNEDEVEDVARSAIEDGDWDDLDIEPDEIWEIEEIED